MEHCSVESACENHYIRIFCSEKEHSFQYLPNETMQCCTEQNVKFYYDENIKTLMLLIVKIKIRCSKYHY